jgi:hypothetical protein
MMTIPQPSFIPLTSPHVALVIVPSHSTQNVAAPYKALARFRHVGTYLSVCALPLDLAMMRSCEIS